MKILYSAYDCNPIKGSEAYCGWSNAFYMSKYHEVYVITRVRHKHDIEMYVKKNNIKNIHFYYVDVPQQLNFLYKHFYLFYINYYLWNYLVFLKALKLHKNIRFDIASHIVLGDFRVPGYLSKLDIPFVFGPVGGGQSTPKSMKKYARKHYLQELIMKWMNLVSVFNPIYIYHVNKAKRIYACNEETQQYIQRVLKDKSKCLILTENGITENQIILGNQRVERKKDVIKLLWAGRMLYRKGLEILIRALKDFDTDTTINLILVGDGPEKANLEELVKQLNLENVVYFIGKVNYMEMQKYYMECDLFVFPSIRESTGTVLFEAMAYKIPIVAYRQNGAKVLLTDETAFLVDIEDKIDPVDSLRSMLKIAIEESELRFRKSEKCYQIAKEKYLWNEKMKIIIDDFRTF